MRYATGPGARRPASLSDNGEWLDTPKARNWLDEWLENKGRYVRLSCGDTDDINDRSVIAIGNRVYCEKCNEWTVVVYSVKFLEYLGLKLSRQPDEPQF